MAISRDDFTKEYANDIVNDTSKLGNKISVVSFTNIVTGVVRFEVTFEDKFSGDSDTYNIVNFAGMRQTVNHLLENT